MKNTENSYIDSKDGFLEEARPLKILSFSVLSEIVLAFSYNFSQLSSSANLLTVE